MKVLQEKYAGRSRVAVCAVSIMLIITLFLSPDTAMSFAEGGFKHPVVPSRIRVYVDLKEVAFPDVAPYIRNDRTMIPLRFVTEKMNARVFWERDGTGVVTIEKTMPDGEERVIRLTVGEAFAYVNGEIKTFDAPGELMSGRVCVPLRFVGETLGCSVRWQAFSRWVFLGTEPYVMHNAFKVPTAGYVLVSTHARADELVISAICQKDIPLPEQAYQDMASILACKYDQKVVDEIMAYARNKSTLATGNKVSPKVIYTKEDEIFVYAREGNQTIMVEIAPIGRYALPYPVKK